MSEVLKHAVRRAVMRLLAPLVRLLLDAGIGVGDFVSILKVAYVREALAQGREGGGEQRRPNITRIAVVTGLTRAEVGAIIAAGEVASATPEWGRQQRAERVLSGWWNDPAFQDVTGHPAVLPEKGSRRSFAALSERYSGGPGFAAILDELIRVRAVRRRRSGEVEAVSRTYANLGWDPEGVAEFGEQLADHGATLVQNLKHPHRPLFARAISNSQVDPKYVPMLLRDLQLQAAGLLESADDALNHPGYTVKPAGSAPAVRLGIGVYLFEEPVQPNGPETVEGRPQSIKRRRGALTRSRPGERT